MQFWLAVDDDASVARANLAAGMESTYRVPFERFERYSPYGSVRQVAEFIAPYLEAGARHINLLPMQESPEANIEAARAIQEALNDITGD